MIDKVRQGGRVFVLDPKFARMEPCAVVAAVASDHWDLAEVAALAGEHFARPAMVKSEIRFGDEEVQGEELFIGEKDIGVTVFVYIDKSQAVISALRVHNRSIRRQPIWERLPCTFAFRPREDRVLRFVADDEFAATIAIQVAKSHTTIHELTV